MIVPTYVEFLPEIPKFCFIYIETHNTADSDINLKLRNLPSTSWIQLPKTFFPRFLIRSNSIMNFLCNARKLKKFT